MSGSFRKRLGVFAWAGLLAMAPAWAATPEMTQDARMTIQVTPKERNQTLFEMRAFLEGFYNIQHSLGKKDYNGVAAMADYIATTFGNTAASLTSVRPEGYDQMSKILIDSFSAVGKAATGKAEMGEVQSLLADVVAGCSGCHQMYRFEVRDKR